MLLNRIIELLFGSKHEHDLKKLLPILHEINAREPWAMSLPEEEFPRQTEKLRNRVQEGETLDDILPEAFALVREAARRILGERLYDVQLLGGIVLHQGKIMEMKTGEGKTVSSVTAAYLNTVAGNAVHIVTVNDYLAQRDAAWMGPVFGFLGVTVGAIAAQMDHDRRKQAYQCDITYGTNNEFGFDYLRDNMAYSISDKVQRGHHFCIVDEIDSILIDEARTPLIISGAAEDDTQKFRDINRVVGELVECEKDPETGDYPEEPIGDYKLDEKSKRVSFTDQGLNHLEKLLQRNKTIQGSLFANENFGLIHYATQAVKAHQLYRRDKEYVVKEGTVQIVDEFTGRILYGRRFSDGLHQAIEAKEGIQVKQRNRTLASITFQNFFRMYNKLSGMTGTAETEEKEFGKIYGLEVVVIPTNQPVARDDLDDLIYLQEDDKYQAISEEIREVNARGQPMLIGTASVERSERLSQVLTSRGIKHEVLNAKNHAREALIIAEAGAKGAVTIATNMAGRGTDIKLGGNPEHRARRRVGTEADQEEYNQAVREEYQRWLDDYEEVKRLGGLYVLGTERHESRRIDNQLRGRSGRQGDPGKSLFFISMDDDLMRLFGGSRTNMKSLMSRVGMRPGEPINSPMINKSIERAQKKVEERNFEIRKHLLEYDDVLNEQRKFIYQQRDEILKDTNLKDRIISTSRDVLNECLEEAQAKVERESDTAAEVLRLLKERVYFSPPNSDELEQLPPDSVREAILDEMARELAEKEQAAGWKLFNLAIRSEYIRNIDRRWRDHLENLEALREAVHLRQYGQKNPLLEYKLEGFSIFDELLYDIRLAIARKFFLVDAETFQQLPEQAAARQQGEAQHSRMGSFAGAGTGTGTSATATASRTRTSQKPAQVVRSMPKVGRNDPCPCGSGKKYKHCHGAT